MDELLRLLKDGNTRTIEQLAAELHTTDADIRRQLEFLEHIGAIRRISAQESGCGSCGGCSGGSCKGCMPQNRIWARCGRSFSADSSRLSSKMEHDFTDGIMLCFKNNG